MSINRVARCSASLSGVALLLALVVAVLAPPQAVAQARCDHIVAATPACTQYMQTECRVTSGLGVAADLQALKQRCVASLQGMLAGESLRCDCRGGSVCAPDGNRCIDPGTGAISAPRTGAGGSPSSGPPAASGPPVDQRGGGSFQVTGECNGDIFRTCAHDCADRLGGFSTGQGTTCMKGCEKHCATCSRGQARTRCMSIE